MKGRIRKNKSMLPVVLGMVYKAVDRIDTRECLKEKAFSFKVPIIFIFNKSHCWSRAHSQSVCAACE